MNYDAQQYAFSHGLATTPQIQLQQHQLHQQQQQQHFKQQQQQQIFQQQYSQAVPTSNVYQFHFAGGCSPINPIFQQKDAHQMGISGNMQSRMAQQNMVGQSFIKQGVPVGIDGGSIHVVGSLNGMFYSQQKNNLKIIPNSDCRIMQPQEGSVRMQQALVGVDMMGTSNFLEQSNDAQQHQSLRVGNQGNMFTYNKQHFSGWLQPQQMSTVGTTQHATVCQSTLPSFSHIWSQFPHQKQIDVLHRQQHLQQQQYQQSQQLQHQQQIQAQQHFAGPGFQALPGIQVINMHQQQKPQQISVPVSVQTVSHFPQQFSCFSPSQPNLVSPACIDKDVQNTERGMQCLERGMSISSQAVHALHCTEALSSCGGAHQPSTAVTYTISGPPKVTVTLDSLSHGETFSPNQFPNRSEASVNVDYTSQNFIKSKSVEISSSESPCLLHENCSLQCQQDWQVSLQQRNNTCHPRPLLHTSSTDSSFERSSSEFSNLSCPPYTFTPPSSIDSMFSSVNAHFQKAATEGSSSGRTSSSSSLMSVSSSPPTTFCMSSWPGSYPPTTTTVPTVTAASSVASATCTTLTATVVFSCNTVAITTTSVTATTPSPKEITSIASVHSGMPLSSASSCLSETHSLSCSPVRRPSMSVVDVGTCRKVKVPYSWHRKYEHGIIVYLSPSGTVLQSFDQICRYLLSDNTCKCGLECPIQVEKFFNFDPEVESQPWTASSNGENLGNLCNHRREILALAAFHSSQAETTLKSADQGLEMSKKRERKKSINAGEGLIVSPLKRLKTSITNAVNRHAMTAAGNVASHASTSATDKLPMVNVGLSFSTTPEPLVDSQGSGTNNSDFLYQSSPADSSSHGRLDSQRSQCSMEDHDNTSTSKHLQPFNDHDDNKQTFLLNQQFHDGSKHVNKVAHTLMQEDNTLGFHQGRGRESATDLPNHYSTGIGFQDTQMLYPQLQVSHHQQRTNPGMFFPQSHVYPNISHVTQQRPQGFHSGMWHDTNAQGQHHHSPYPSHSNFGHPHPVTFLKHNTPNQQAFGSHSLVDTKKAKSKRPKSKKDKQKQMNSIVDRSSPCLKTLPKTAKTAVIPSTSASFFGNPIVFVEQQTAMINNSIASCHITCSSPSPPQSDRVRPGIYQALKDNVCENKTIRPHTDVKNVRDIACENKTIRPVRDMSCDNKTSRPHTDIKHVRDMSCENKTIRPQTDIKPVRDMACENKTIRPHTDIKPVRDIACENKTIIPHADVKPVRDIACENKTIIPHADVKPVRDIACESKTIRPHTDVKHVRDMTYENKTIKPVRDIACENKTIRPYTDVKQFRDAACENQTIRSHTDVKQFRNAACENQTIRPHADVKQFRGAACENQTIRPHADIKHVKNTSLDDMSKNGSSDKDEDDDLKTGTDWDSNKSFSDATENNDSAYLSQTGSDQERSDITDGLDSCLETMSKSSDIYYFTTSSEASEHRKNADVIHTTAKSMDINTCIVDSSVLKNPATDEQKSIQELRAVTSKVSMTKCQEIKKMTKPRQRTSQVKGDVHIQDIDLLKKKLPGNLNGDLSMLLASNNWNIPALQQVLAQYSGGDPDQLTAALQHLRSQIKNTGSDFPASNLLTAAARAQLNLRQKEQIGSSLPRGRKAPVMQKPDVLQTLNVSSPCISDSKASIVSTSVCGAVVSSVVTQQQSRPSFQHMGKSTKLMGNMINFQQLPSGSFAMNMLMSTNGQGQLYSADSVHNGAAFSTDKDLQSGQTTLNPIMAQGILATVSQTADIGSQIKLPVASVIPTSLANVAQCHTDGSTVLLNNFGPRMIMNAPIPSVMSNATKSLTQVVPSISINQTMFGTHQITQQLLGTQPNGTQIISTGTSAPATHIINTSPQGAQLVTTAPQGTQFMNPVAPSTHLVGNTSQTSQIVNALSVQGLNNQLLIANPIQQVSPSNSLSQLSPAMAAHILTQGHQHLQMSPSFLQNQLHKQNPVISSQGIFANVSLPTLTVTSGCTDPIASSLSQAAIINSGIQKKSQAGDTHDKVDLAQIKDSTASLSNTSVYAASSQPVFVIPQPSTNPVMQMLGSAQSLNTTSGLSTDLNILPGHLSQIVGQSATVDQSQIQNLLAAGFNPLAIQQMVNTINLSGVQQQQQQQQLQMLQLQQLMLQQLQNHGQSIQGISLPLNQNSSPSQTATIGTPAIMNAVMPQQNLQLNSVVDMNSLHPCLSPAAQGYQNQVSPATAQLQHISSALTVQQFTSVNSCAAVGVIQNGSVQNHLIQTPPKHLQAGLSLQPQTIFSDLVSQSSQNLTTNSLAVSSSSLHDTTSKSTTAQTKQLSTGSLKLPINTTPAAKPCQTSKPKAKSKSKKSESKKIVNPDSERNEEDIAATVQQILAQAVQQQKELSLAAKNQPPPAPKSKSKKSQSRSKVNHATKEHDLGKLASISDDVAITRSEDVRLKDNPTFETTPNCSTLLGPNSFTLVSTKPDVHQPLTISQSNRIIFPTETPPPPHSSHMFNSSGPHGPTVTNFVEQTFTETNFINCNAKKSSISLKDHLSSIISKDKDCSNKKTSIGTVQKQQDKVKDNCDTNHTIHPTDMIHVESSFHPKTQRKPIK